MQETAKKAKSITYFEQSLRDIECKTFVREERIKIFKINVPLWQILVLGLGK